MGGKMAKKFKYKWIVIVIIAVLAISLLGSETGAFSFGPIKFGTAQTSDTSSTAKIKTIDLVVQSIDVTRGDKDDSVVTIVKNQGNKDAFNFRVQVKDSQNNKIINIFNVNVLRAGKDTTLPIQYKNAPDSSYTVEVIADVGKQINEVNEGNNVKTKKVGPRPLPDLIVESISAAKKPDPNDTISDEITVVIKNQGTASAEKFATKLTDTTSNNILGNVWTIGELAAGEKETMRIWYAWAETDTYTIQAIADVGAKVRESNENNNKKSQSVTP